MSQPGEARLGRADPRALRARLAACAEVLERAYRAIAHDVRQGDFIESAAEWLLDNYHVIVTEIRQVRRDLPPGFYRQLPPVTTAAPGDPPRGTARIHALALELVGRHDARLDRRQLVQFLTAYQAQTPLTLGELWAWPSAFKAALLDQLRALSEELLEARRSRRAADAYLARAIDAPRGAAPPGDGPPSPTFLVQLLHRGREYGVRGGQVWDALEAQLGAGGSTEEDVIRAEHRRQAVSQASFANAITSLRLTGMLDWSAFVESVSLVEQVLRRDPAGAHARTDFLSRDRLRGEIEQLAPRDGAAQVQIALRTVDLARESAARRHADHREAHVGYYLIDRGRQRLEEITGARPRWAVRWRRGVRRHATPLYLGAIGLLTTLLVIAGAGLAGAMGDAGLLTVLAAIALVIPASEVAVFLVNRLVTAVMKPSRLSRMAVTGPLPPEARTVVVVPTLLTSVEAARDMVAHLEVLALGNLDPVIHFALLTDFPDAPARDLPEDEPILAAARLGIEELNRRYRRDAFFLFHRERRWNEGERVWMGWERKRGKLEEFNRLLRGAEDTSYTVTVTNREVLGGARYCLTLDSDTHLPRDAAKVLVGILEHPLNRPQIDPQLGRVTDGYGLLQPRVSVTMASAAGSRFARLYAGHTGVDPYTTAVSDAYQDLFGEGIYTGKGLYDIDAFNASLEGRVPENALLSHDLFEGAHARAALVSDVEVVDDYPSSVLAHARRQHRWVRGDWQILRWLLPIVPTATGYARNRLSLISRWKILDNLRRSLGAPATLALFVLGWAVLPGRPWAWTLAALASLASPAYGWFFGVITGPAHEQQRRVFLRGAWLDLRVAAMHIALQTTFLAQQAWTMLHAIGLTLIRIGVTQRGLLEWETAADSARRIGGVGLGAFWRRMKASPAIAGLAALLVVGVAPEAWQSALPLLLVWAAAPVIAWTLSRPTPTARRPLSDADRTFFTKLAGLTWAYFAMYTGPADNDLPPDNVQMVPTLRVARRTSPTNIAMGLLAAACARALGFIDADECLDRLERAADTLDRMDRQHGHWLNWYDTETLAVLPPGYVSTVDSGNLAAVLMTLPAALREIAGEAPALHARVGHLVDRLDTFLTEMDFRWLYDEARGLFTIGYRMPDLGGPGGPDPSFYDLLASEARLASFVAIAKGDVPQSHWFRLGRPLTSLNGTPVLLSWSASMFEYLMPLLLTRHFPDTLLDQTCRAVIDRQVRYGTVQGVPWGISESAYGVVDRHQTYQYQAFGVPGLGLKRGLGDDLVIAPYASALAAMIEPAAAAANLRRLVREGATGDFGYYDAVDYTVRTATEDHAAAAEAAAPHVVATYFAHHQGMTLAALTNVLDADRLVGWFHTDPRVRATELLLQERMPRQATAGDPRPREDVRATVAAPPPPVRRIRSPHTAFPHAQFLSNGECVSVVTHAGGGHLSFRGRAISRARPDATTDEGSQCLYVRDVRDDRTWSAAFQPTAAEPDEYLATFRPEQARYSRRDGEITTRLDVAVSSEDHVEVRMLTITNHGTRVRELDVTSYVELALASPVSDLAHPAFGKLFLITHAMPDIQALLCQRRPRDQHDDHLWAMHVISAARRPGGPVEWETDRARFIGRGRTLRAPAALDGRALSGTTGLVLDPIFSLRQRLRIEPGASARLSFSTGIAHDRATAEALARKYREVGAARQAFMQAFTDEQSRVRHLDVSAEDARLFDRLASRTLYADESLRAAPDLLAANRLGQPGLWRFAISGDLPILLVRVSGPDGRALVRQALQAQEYWRLKGLTADVVILNEHAVSYLDEMHGSLAALLDTGPWRSRQHRPGGAYLLRADQITPAEATLLASVARAVLHDARGTLAAQLNLPPEAAPRPEARVPPPVAAPAPATEPLVTVPPLRLANGLGGFTEDGREYVIVLDGTATTPLPWVNVIANPRFGTIVTEAGAAYTWAVNSRENRLTPFANDPVVDPSAEALYIRDEDTGDVWCPTPGPAPRPANDRYIVRHAPGRTTFDGRHAGIEHELEVYVHVEAPVKFSRLTLRNMSHRPRRLRVYAYQAWALGPPVAGVSDYVITSRDTASGGVLAENAFNVDFAARTAFVATSDPVRAVTGDRRTFLGRHGAAGRPAGVHLDQLDNRLGAGLDPCAVLETEVTLAPGDTHVMVCLLGQGRNADEARQLAATYRPVERATAARDEVDRFWRDVLETVQVRTPDDSFDLAMNGWLLYQTLTCRIWARSGYHQPGGAFGFRDQLQDVLALLMVRPELTRAHIVRAAGRQFVEGDVQHWWHEPSGRGLRSRCSDDLLWLPFAVTEYITSTGDATVLDEVVAFLEGPPLAPDQHEAYGEPVVSSSRASVYEHSVRAIEHGLTAGPHGLPLFGSGDWNDGMNRVGEGGRGESTWLGFFLHVVLTRFADICSARGDGSRANRYRQEAARLSQKLELAWDGEWFRRGYYDDGTPLGSAQNDECKIDAISQSWAVLSGAVPRRFAELAMDAVRAHLVQRGPNVLPLLDPPFDRSAQEPGYIKAYPPGVRENGGQYTHAAVWTVMAFAALGAGDEAGEMLHMLNPVNRSRTPEGARRYKLEPYVVAGDVYSQPPHDGRGGWSWYTGSAGWFFRAGLEHLLGIRRRGETLEIAPCVPTSWPGFEVTWKFGRSVYTIAVHNPLGRSRGVARASLDGEPVPARAIPIADDGRVHRIEVVLGEPDAESSAPRPAALDGAGARRSNGG